MVAETYSRSQVELQGMGSEPMEEGHLEMPLGAHPYKIEDQFRVPKRKRRKRQANSLQQDSPAISISKALSLVVHP